MARKVNADIDCAEKSSYPYGMNARQVLKNAKRAAQKSGLSYREIGIRMGYPSASARQSVSQFLNSTNPSVEMLLRLARAIQLDVRKLL